jgi:protease I
MAQLQGKKVAILATDGFEQSELTEPKRRLEEAGAKVDVIAPKTGKIRGWKFTDWGEEVKVDKGLDKASIEDYDALVLPGGVINPDKLRIEPKAVDLVRKFYATGKPLAAICHGPWLLIEAGVIRGRRATSYKSIRTDMRNAGAEWVDEPVVVDQGLITSRQPDDLEAFSKKIIEEIREGRHTKRQAAE